MGRPHGLRVSAGGCLSPAAGCVLLLDEALWTPQAASSLHTQSPDRHLSHGALGPFCKTSLQQGRALLLGDTAGRQIRCVSACENLACFLGRRSLPLFQGQPRGMAPGTALAVGRAGGSSSSGQCGFRILWGGA